MNNVLSKLKQSVSRVRGLFPSALPFGVTEFNTWADSIISTYGFPDNDSIRFSLAVMIMHLPPNKAAIRKSYLATCLKKGAANQVAAQMVQDLKTKQDAALAAARAAAAAASSQSSEATTTPLALSVVSSNENKQ